MIQGVVRVVDPPKGATAGGWGFIVFGALGLAVVIAVARATVDVPDTFFYSPDVLIAEAVLLVGSILYGAYRVLVLAGRIPVLYSKRTAEGWSVGSLVAHVYASAVRVDADSAMTLSSKPRPRKSANPGPPKGYDWKLTTKDQTSKAFTWAPVTDAEHTQLAAWLSSLHG